MARPDADALAPFALPLRREGDAVIADANGQTVLIVDPSRNLDEDAAERIADLVFARLSAAAPEVGAAEDLREALIQADLKIRSLPGTDQSDVEFIREVLATREEAPAPCTSCNGSGMDAGSRFNRCPDCCEEAPAEAGDIKHFAASMAEDGALRAQPPASPSTLAELHAAERLIDQQAAEIRRLKAREDAQAWGTLADLVSWFTTPVQGQNGMVWVIPAGEQGADDAVNAALAALQADQKGGA